MAYNLHCYNVSGPFMAECSHKNHCGEVVNIMEFDRELDARGLNCPLPILRTKKALAEMLTGQVLRVMATDTGSVRDFQAFAKQTGNDLLAHAQDGDEFTFFMRRK